MTKRKSSEIETEASRYLQTHAEKLVRTQEEQIATYEAVGQNLRRSYSATLDKDALMAMDQLVQTLSEYRAIGAGRTGDAWRALVTSIKSVDALVPTLDAHHPHNSIRAASKSIRKLRRSVETLIETKDGKKMKPSIRSEPALTLGENQWLPRLLTHLHACLPSEAAYGANISHGLRAVHKQVLNNNLFSYLQVVYTAPPSGTLRISPSPKLLDLAWHMRGYLDHLCTSAPQEPKELEHSLKQMHMVCISFHELVLHLYGLAMRKADRDETWQRLKQRAEQAVKHDIEQRQYLKEHAPWLESGSTLLRRTVYASTSLAVYVAAHWQSHADVSGTSPLAGEPYVLGDRRDLAAAKDEILCAMDDSKLGTEAFTGMSIEEVGKLEESVKRSLRMFVDAAVENTWAEWVQRFRDQPPPARSWRDQERAMLSVGDMVDGSRRKSKKAKLKKAKFHAPTRVQIERPRQQD